MQTAIRNEVIQFLGEYAWLFISGLALLVFRSTLSKMFDGLSVFLGNDYNEDDVVEVDGKPGRIIRVGMWKTVFFLYEIKDGGIISGSKLVVQNERLKSMKIEKPLPLLNMEKYKVREK